MNVFNVQHFIPQALWNDRNCRAMAMAIQAGMRKLNSSAKVFAKALTDIDTMPESRLDDLLWEFNLTPETDVSVSAKREILRNAYSINRGCGTANSLSAYLSAMSRATWAGKRPVNAYGDPSVLAILAGEGLTESLYEDIRKNSARFIPLAEQAYFYNGQSIGVKCRLWTDLNGFMCSEFAGATDRMRGIVKTGLQSLFHVSRLYLYLIVNGAEQSMGSTQTSYEVNDLLLHYSVPNSGYQGFKLTDASGNVLAEKSMEDTAVIGNAFYVKVFTAYNDEKAPVPSIDMSSRSTRGILDAIKTTAFVNSLSVRVTFADGTQETFEGCTTVDRIAEGFWATGYKFTLDGVEAGSRISTMELIDATGTLILAQPETKTRELVMQDDPVMTFYLGMKYGGEAESSLGHFVLGISALR